MAEVLLSSTEIVIWGLSSIYCIIYVEPVHNLEAQRVESVLEPPLSGYILFINLWCFSFILHLKHFYFLPERDLKMNNNKMKNMKPIGEKKASHHEDSFFKI